MPKTSRSTPDGARNEKGPAEAGPSIAGRSERVGQPFGWFFPFVAT